MATSSTPRKMFRTVIPDELIGEVTLKSEYLEPEDGSDDSLQQSSMSLDVLARVATETLERSGSDDSSTYRPVAKKPKKVSRGTTDVMTLEQIRMLSDKVLVNTFAELNSDEIKRKYTYRCWLMPDKCQEQFSSFGNETKARQYVKAHLLAHIGSLLQEECTPGKGGDKFTAEPINVRKRRLAGGKGQKRKRRISSGSKSPTSNYMAKITAPITTYTTIKSRKKVMDNALHDDWSPKKRSTASKSRKKSFASSRRTTAKVDTSAVESLEEPPELSETLEMFKLRSRIEEEKMKQQEAREKDVLERLTKVQPFMDHCYTTIFGPQVIVEAYGEGPQFEDEDDIDVVGVSRADGVKKSPSLLETDDDKTICITLNDESSANTNTLHIPVIRMSKLPVSSDGMLVVSAEEIVQDWNENEEGGFVPTSARPYPPMPKLDNSKTGKLMFPEEYTSSDDDMPAPPKGLKITNRKTSKSNVEGTSEWERKMALKCIRELRCQRKQDVSLVCKICQDKAFTATATLMYHYRSHAGIKPFVCLICNTTFTRQHSLNYHMLIHNNQSRFMCPDCGRKFRHPSHYKEHRRRHTGETPFHCMDCPLRFKTRNTYKRHLKTRHGKLLTADGIQYITYDDRGSSSRQVRYRGIEASHKGIVLVEGLADEAYFNDEGDDDNLDDEEEVYVEEIEETAIEDLE